MDQGLSQDPGISPTCDTQHVFESRKISVPSNGKLIHQTLSCSELHSKET